MRVSLLLAGLLAIILLCGCSGGGGVGGGDEVGTLKFTVKFPALPDGQVMPQYLPPALMSLVIQVIDTDTGEPKCDPIIVNRTSPDEEVITVSIEAVHIGNTTLIIKGYDGLDGTGQVICDATAQVTVEPNVAVDVNMTMATTVVRIEVNGAPSVLVGNSEPLYATGYDVDDNVVLDASFTWSSEDTDIATVADAGPGAANVTGVARGATDIKVEEAKGIAAPALHNMTVNPNIDRVEIETVGEPYVLPAGGTPANSTIINIEQTQDITVKCYQGETEVTNVPITLTSADAAVVSVSQDGTGSPDGEIYGVQETTETPVTITATQPYTGAEGTLDVTVTALGDINVHID
ncbi:MAG: Ig-like domain-containing protein [Armatimonadetes bacterium]|nr:Ig-like domain-containing protein [Armatimonadota bacterium]